MTLVDFLGVGDVGTVVNPRSLHRRRLHGGMLPRHRPRAVPEAGSTTRTTALSLARRFHHNKPLTILDIPPTMHDGGARHRRSGDAGRRARRRRAAGRRRLRRGAERDCRRDRRGCVPPRAGHVGHRADVARARQAHARAAAGAHLATADTVAAMLATAKAVALRTSSDFHIQSRALRELGIRGAQFELVEPGRRENRLRARRAGNRELHRAGPLQHLPFDDEPLAARQAFIVRAAEQIQLFVDARPTASADCSGAP